MNGLAVLIMALGWVLFVLSFFLTAIVTVDDTVLGWRVVWHVGFPGWLAALLGFASLEDLRAEPLRAIVAFAAALTNIVMLASPWAVIKPRSRVSRGLLRAALVAILVDLAVLGIWQQDTVLGPGYYFWVASFVVVTVGLYMAQVQAIAHGHGVSESRVA